MRTNIKKLVATGLIMAALTSSFAAEAEWSGVAVKRTTAYTDSALTRRNGVEYVDAGDTITVLQEAGNAYYVRYPLARGGYKERWVSKDVFGNATNNSQGTSVAVSNSYTQWQGVANTRATAYTNAALTSRNGVEYVDAGDTVTVLNESGNAYYVRYPLARGGTKDRWVNKSAINRPGTTAIGAATASAAAKAISVATSTAANYQQWQGYSPNRLTAYTNAALTARNANEWVGAGDTVTVLNESGNAYYVRYPLMNGGTKDRWVSKNGIQRPGSNNVGAATASAAAKAISIATSTAANYQQWQGYSPNRLTAYTNAALTARNANEWVGAGDTVTVLNESGNAYYVRYPLMRGGYKDRWVSKSGIQKTGSNQNANVGTSIAAAGANAISQATTTAVNYQQWQGYSPNRLTAYTNAALTARNANEWVGAGDTVTVLNESGNAYYVRYPLMRGGYKDRWVNKSGIQRVTAVQSNGIRANGLNQAVTQQTATRNAAQSLSRNAGTVSNYQQWQGYCPNRLTAYTNSALTTRYPNEWVGAGDTVTVLNEEGNAYFVSYPLMKGGTKERWVKKSGIQKDVNNNITQNYQSLQNSTSINSDVQSGQVQLNVIYFAQNDSKWKNEYVNDKARNPHTIGSVGCLLTSMAMKYSYHTGNSVPPNVMKNYCYFGGTNGNDMLVDQTVKDLGYEYEPLDKPINNTILQTIYNKLKENRPVIIGRHGSQHWVVIIGYKGNYPQSSLSTADFIINDPLSISRKDLNAFLGNNNVRKIIY